MKTIIIGIDGFSWRQFQQWSTHLPFLSDILKRYEVGMLTSDAPVLHSSITWSLAFAGAVPNKEFQERAWDRWPTVDDYESWCFHWVWDMYKDAAVYNVPVCLPPICRNVDDSEWILNLLPVTESEIYNSIHATTDIAEDALAQSYDLNIFVYQGTDSAGHLFYGDPQDRLLDVYKEMDRNLERLWTYLDGNRWMILSDHGMTTVLGSVMNGWYPAMLARSASRVTGMHDPYGLVATNMYTLPEKLSDVYQLIIDSLGE